MLRKKFPCNNVCCVPVMKDYLPALFSVNRVSSAVSPEPSASPIDRANLCNIIQIYTFTFSIEMPNAA